MTREPVPAEPGPADVLGPLEAAIMRILWQRGEASVGVVHRSLPAEEGRTLAYTTVMTVLTRLHEKGLTRRTRDGRQFLYRPAMSQAELVAVLGRRAVDAVVDRYGTTALVRFAQRLDDLDPMLRAELLALARTPAKDEGP